MLDQRCEDHALRTNTIPRCFVKTTNQYHIWDTVNTDLADDIRYSPKVPGTYTWPRSDAVGYYKNIYAGPLPIFECDTSTPSGTVKLDECYITRLPPNEVFTQDYLELPVQGENGMSPQVSALHSCLHLRDIHCFPVSHARIYVDMLLLFR